MFVLWVSLYLYCINASFYMTSLNERHRICLKLKLKIRFRYIINMYIYFIKNKNLIVSWYYNTILRYDTADNKTILPSIPILKTLLHTSTKLVRSVDYLMSNQLLCCCHPCRWHPPKLPMGMHMLWLHTYEDLHGVSISTNNTAWGRDGHKTVVGQKKRRSFLIRQKNRIVPVFVRRWYLRKPSSVRKLDLDCK
jgi:hypothetical protein